MTLTCSDCVHSVLDHTEGINAKCKHCSCELLKAPIRKESKAPKVLSAEDSPYVPGCGSPFAKLMFIGEAPGKNESEEGKPFVGMSGRVLDELLNDIGQDRSSVYITNVVKVRPPNNDLKRLSEINRTIEEFVPQLWEEINAINPNVLVPLGNLALETLTGFKGIHKYRGSILRSLDSKRKVIPTLHPANLLPNSPSMLSYSARTYIRLDLARAFDESLHDRYEIPQRALIVTKSADQLSSLIRQNLKASISVDIETYKSIPTCIGIAFNPHLSVSTPLVRQSSKFDKVDFPDYEIEELWRIIGELLANPEITKIGQNFKFDDERLYNTCHMPIFGTVFDIMHMAHTLHSELPKSLGFLASIYSREPFWKDEGKEFNPGKDKLERLFLYNAKDAAVTFELFETLKQELTEANLWEFYLTRVQPLHELYFNIEDKGFNFNEDRRKELQKEYRIKAKQLSSELDNLAGYHINTGSPKQVGKLLFDELRFPKRDSTDEDTLVALQANHAKTNADQNRIIPLILDNRRIKKAIGTYIDALTDYDGRMRSSFNIVGTETGRSSTSKYGPPHRPENIGLAFQTVTEHGDFGTEIQECFVADPGYILISVDLEQAEPRVVAILSDDQELLDDFDRKIDIHSKTASWFFGVPMDQIPKKDPVTGQQNPMRFVGKMGRNGGNYGMKKRRLMTEINSNAKKFHIDINVSEYKAGQILETFHSKNPKIRSIFHDQIQSAIRNHRTLTNPFGRKRVFFDRFSEDLYKEAYAHIPQSTVKDKLADSMLAILAQRPSTCFLRESHDAFVIQCREDEVEEYRQLIEYELTKPIDFEKCTLQRGKLIIPCEIKIGYNLGDMR